MLTTDPASTDHFHEECGVFGVYGHPDAAALTALGLHALQHRGQEAAGIVAYDGRQFSAHRGPGLVSDNFSSKEVIAKLPGAMAIGHVRYATTGEVALRNIQPLFADFEFGGLAICHNGSSGKLRPARRPCARHTARARLPRRRQFAIGTSRGGTKAEDRAAEPGTTMRRGTCIVL